MPTLEDAITGSRASAEAPGVFCPPATLGLARAFHHADYLVHVLRENADLHHLAPVWCDVIAQHDVPAWTDGEAWRALMNEEDWCLLASVWRLLDACETASTPRNVSLDECRAAVQAVFPEPLRW